MRILVADDHEIVRRGMRSLLEARDGWQVCAECSNGREAVAKTVELRPEVAVLDYTMPQLNGIDAIRQIRRMSPATATILYTVHDTEQMVREVLLAGAGGYVAKSTAPQDLVSAIDAAHRHLVVFLAQSFESVVRKLTADPGSRLEGEPALLTGREREIVQLLVEGRSNKEVAASLDLSVKTVEVQRARIMRKLRVSSAAGIVRYAIRNRLVDA